MRSKNPLVKIVYWVVVGLGGFVAGLWLYSLLVN
jgi:hypothetical protein